MTQPQIQRASKANIHQLPPPAAKKEIEQALPADKRDDFKDLMKATSAHARWQGLALGLVLGVASGWFMYDMSVKAVSDTLQDQAIKSEIAKQIAKEVTR